MRRPPDIHADCWRYQPAEGWEILVGKTDRDNEILSLKRARPDDWWFHVKSQPGSHVLLRGPEGEEPDREILRAAASAAAWHSKARKAGKVPVSYTRACHVTKARGAPVGTVQIKREKVLQVRPGIPAEE